MPGRALAVASGDELAKAVEFEELTPWLCLFFGLPLEGNTRFA